VFRPIVPSTSPRLPTGTPAPRSAPAVRVAALALVLALVLALAARGPGAAHAAGGFAPNAGVLGAATTNASMIPPTPGRAKEFTFLRANGLFHIFYMRDNLAVNKDSTEHDFGHAVSSDLVHWTQLSPVMAVRPDKWDNAHVWAPHVVEQNGIYYMYYVGVTYEPFAWTWYQRIGIATSTDLMNWTRYDQPVYGGDRIPWAYADSSQFDGSQCRDPYLMPDPDNPGQWLMYFVTEPATAHGQLIVGVARNSGGFTPFQDVGPIWSTDAAHYWGWVESPCVFQHDGLWYMFCTTTSGHVINFRTATTLTTDSTQWAVKYRLWDMVGQDPQSDTWFGVEHLNVDGHDYLAYVDPYDSGIDFQEMVWGTPPAFFALAQPVTAGVPSADPPRTLALAVLGRSGDGDGDGAVLRLSLPEAGAVRIDLYDVSGRRVRALAAGSYPRGESLVRWDARDGAGARVRDGIYFARVRTASGERSARVLVTG